MLATHRDAEQRYSEIRKTALKAVAVQMPPTLQKDLALCLFNDEALKASKVWGQSPGRRVDWDWVYGYYGFKFRHPKRFELALWYKGQLVSLSLGRPTYNAAGLRLDFIEGDPDNRELKVFPIVLATMATYAEMLGATELRVLHPINVDVKRYYERFGFTYVAKGDYLYSKLL